MNNISLTVKNGLCMGCGVCKDACPKHCIEIQHGVHNRPYIDVKECINCGKCLKVCAGNGIDIKAKSESLFYTPSICSNTYIGDYLKCFKGYSTDEEIRYHCASGGCVSTLLIFLLQKGLIDGAVVTGFQHDDVMRPNVYIARSKEDILKGKSSKYCVVSMDGIATDIKKNKGKYVIVGLPCHIQSFRKLADIDKTFRESVIGYFAIYCSANKNMLSQEYMRWRYGINPDELTSFAYRDEGCLGSMIYRCKNRVKKIDFLDYYCGVRAFFNESRCNVCTDFYGELADISFGDLNTGDDTDDPIGINSLVVRSEFWLSILESCSKEGNLYLCTIDEKTMIDAQSYCTKYKKGKGFFATWNLRKLFGLRNPQYDNLVYVTPDLKSYINAIAKIMMYTIGKHRSLWFIIKLLDKNKK